MRGKWKLEKKGKHTKEKQRKRMSSMPLEGTRIQGFENEENYGSILETPRGLTKRKAPGKKDPHLPLSRRIEGVGKNRRKRIEKREGAKVGRTRINEVL